MLGGCFNKPPTEKPSEELSMLHVEHISAQKMCLHYMCRADSNDAEVQRIRQEYGLEKLTNARTEKVFLQVEGDWLVWLATDPNLMETRGDIWAMNLPTRELYGVRVGPGHSIRPFLDSGRVVFQYSSDNYTGFLVWEVGDDVVAPLDVDIQGNYWLWDLAGDWVAFSMGALMDGKVVAQEQVANLRTGEVRVIYQPPFAESGAREQIYGVALSDHFAYYVVDRTEGENLGHWFHQVNLTSGADFELRAPMFSAAIAAGSQRVLIQGDPRYTVFDVDNQTLQATAFPGSPNGPGRCNPASANDNNDWTVLLCQDAPAGAFKFYSLETDQTKIQLPEDGMNMQTPATDGKTVAFIAGSRGKDIFIKPFSALEDWEP